MKKVICALAFLFTIINFTYSQGGLISLFEPIRICVGDEVCVADVESPKDDSLHYYWEMDLADGSRIKIDSNQTQLCFILDQNEIVFWRIVHDPIKCTAFASNAIRIVADCRNGISGVPNYCDTLEIVKTETIQETITVIDSNRINELTDINIELTIVLDNVQSANDSLRDANDSLQAVIENTPQEVIKTTEFVEVCSNLVSSGDQLCDFRAESPFREKLGFYFAVVNREGKVSAATFQILDGNGNSVLDPIEDFNFNFHQGSFLTADLPIGVYYLKVSFEIGGKDYYAVRKIIKA